MMPELLIMFDAVRFRFCAVNEPWLVMFVAFIARLPALLIVAPDAFRKLFTFVKLKLKLLTVLVKLSEFRTERGTLDEIKE